MYVTIDDLKKIFGATKNKLFFVCHIEKSEFLDIFFGPLSRRFLDHHFQSGDQK